METTWMMFVWLFALNFASVYLAVWTLSNLERRRRRAAGKLFMEEIGQKMAVDHDFMKIMKREFENGREEEGR